MPHDVLGARSLILYASRLHLSFRNKHKYESVGIPSNEGLLWYQIVLIALPTTSNEPLSFQSTAQLEQWLFSLHRYLEFETANINFMLVTGLGICQNRANTRNVAHYLTNRPPVFIRRFPRVLQILTPFFWRLVHVNNLSKANLLMRPPSLGIKYAIRLPYLGRLRELNNLILHRLPFSQN